jgi:hypothetical protein
MVKMTANVDDCLKNLTRGALKNNPLNYSLKIFSELRFISDKYETEFLRSGKQRLILRELTMLKLEKFVEEINDNVFYVTKQ